MLSVPIGTAPVVITGTEMLEPNYILHTEETQYRVRPNPDTNCSTYQDGIVLEWKEPEDTEWKGYFFLAGSAVPDLIKALKLLGPSRGS